MDHSDLIEITTGIVAAHVANNAVALGEVAGLIDSTYAALAGLGKEPEPVDAREPAVPIPSSLAPGYIVCLECGAKQRMLKRHLKTSHGLSPEQYRQRWKLQPGYPMVAPNCSKLRSQIAKQTGLGKRPS